MDHTNEQEDPTTRALRMAREEWTEPYRAALERINRLAADWATGMGGTRTPSERTALATMVQIERVANSVLYPQKERQQNG
jgi:hypothetical protein